MTRRQRKAADVGDVWWQCLRANCYLFFLSPTARDEHTRTCAGCEEIPF